MVLMLATIAQLMRTKQAMSDKRLEQKVSSTVLGLHPLSLRYEKQNYICTFLFATKAQTVKKIICLQGMFQRLISLVKVLLQRRN
jgi:hypothetical protein